MGTFKSSRDSQPAYSADSETHKHQTLIFTSTQSWKICLKSEAETFTVSPVWLKRMENHFEFNFCLGSTEREWGLFIPCSSLFCKASNNRQGHMKLPSVQNCKKIYTAVILHTKIACEQRETTVSKGSFLLSRATMINYKIEVIHWRAINSLHSPRQTGKRVIQRLFKCFPLCMSLLENVCCEKVQGPSSKNRSVDCALVLVWSPLWLYSPAR